MEIFDQRQSKIRGNSYERCFRKAMNKTRQLLCEKDAAQDYEKVHEVKSLLYSTIERAGMETNRMISAQELLRELLTLVVLQADPVRHERQEALGILDQLRARYLSGG